MNKTTQYTIILGLVLVGLIFLRHEKGAKMPPAVISNDGILSDFENKKVWGTDPESGFSLQLSNKYVTQGKYSLEVGFPKEDLPSLNTKRLPQKWGQYDSFAFDVYNPQKESISFAIRLDDVHKKRISIPRTLENGWNKIKISRADIAEKIDAGNIRFVVLYLDGPDKRYKLYFDNMRLENLQLSTENEKEEAVVSQEKNAAALPFRKAVILPPKPVDLTGEIKVALAKAKEVSGNMPLISTGVPFAPGQLKSEKDFVFMDGQGKEIPIAVKVLARWPQDLSIRSVLVQFKHPVEQAYEYVTFKWGVPRTLLDLPIIEPNWQYSEGMIVMPAKWLCDSEVIGEQVPMG